MAKKRSSRFTIDTTNTAIDDRELPQTLGDFVKVDDVGDGEVAIIKSPAYVMTSRYGSSRVVSIELDGSRKLLRLNKFSLQSLVDAYGADSKDWVGKRVVLRKRKIANMNAIVVEVGNE